MDQLPLPLQQAAGVNLQRIVARLEDELDMEREKKFETETHLDARIGNVGVC